MNLINEIVLGDVLETLKRIPDESFDLGVTSPPYNKQKNRKGVLVKDIKYSDITDNSDESDYQVEQIEILNELYRTIKPGGSFFYNHKIRWDKGEMFHPIDWLKKTDWVVKQEIVWDRNIAANIRGWRFWQTDERVYWLYKPDGKNKIGKELASKHARMTGIWEIMPENKNPHPAPFPIDLVSRIIYSILDEDREGKLVIDPYMGSGTTAVSCKLLGCDYVGIDISDSYIEMANERIENYLSHKEKHDKEMAKHVITGVTYKERKRLKAEKAAAEEQKKSEN